MAGIVYEIDPTSEDASNANLVIVDNSTYFLLGDDCPAPPPRTTFVDSVDTEGSPPVESKYDNRRVTLQIRVVSTTDALLETAVNNVQKKVAKLTAEGGTLKRTTASGDTVVFDVYEASVSAVFDRGYTVSKRTTLSVEFTCAPFARGAAVTKTLRSESTLPALVFTETSITGDVPALGKLVITEAQAVDQWWVIWGQQSRYYDASSSAALFFEAEGRTAMGGSATAAGPSGASGAGSNVMRNTALGTAFQAILSTQATGGGAHLSHVGDFQVFARVQIPTTNTGTTTLALEWAEGDFRRWTRNGSTDLRAAFAEYGQWWLVDLGQVHLTKVVSGTQRWEGRIIARSTVAGDDIDIDHLMLVPITEGSGRVSGVLSPSSPTSFAARDEFDQAAGALTGKTAPVGGVWAGAGDATDFSVEATGHTAQRTELSDASGVGRYAISGASAMTSTLVQVDVSSTATYNPLYQAVVARYTDTNNWVMARMSGGITPIVSIQKKVAGTTTSVAFSSFLSYPEGSTYSLRMHVDAAGRVAAWWFPQGSLPGDPVVVGYDSTLATGGALASGKPGFYDENQMAINPTRTYDNFWAAAPAADAALFASQSLEVRHNQVIREDSGGTLWPTVSKYEGNYLLVPPAGKEARTLRMIVKACRNDPALSADPAIDDISAQLTVTPRYLVLPE